MMGHIPDLSKYTSCKVFLDLEKVLVESWEDWNLLYWNTEIISRYAALTEFHVDLFSNAIDGDADLKFFYSNQKHLENEFGIIFDDATSCKERMEMQDFNESMYIYKNLGKKVCFIEYVKHITTNECELYILLDDTVQDELLHYESFSILLVKVDK